jgi:hypothetical protein
LHHFLHLHHAFPLRGTFDNEVGQAVDPLLDGVAASLE